MLLNVLKAEAPLIVDNFLGLGFRAKGLGFRV